MKRKRRLEVRSGRQQIDRRTFTLDVVRQIPHINGTPLPQQLIETKLLCLDRPPT
jgi:hypothetical protein